MDNNSLAHTKWNCKYHIVFSPKYRRREIYGKLKEEIGKILRELCKWKGVEIIEANLNRNGFCGHQEGWYNKARRGPT